ncbi:hypothetical protein EK21DRAFT_115174 [Setomelanomma holmii]|uniref:DUF7730 domain-containing protein n=1 Tax=Setomelanomma holmii TaxID=210430 RepID=A0A9P4H4F2_9PLEO|nr:hypothetical protein EK21DRAFT_115174 [Setomelanomma holmii]
MARYERLSPFFRIPAELRLNIYEYVIGSRIVHVRSKWTGICTPAGFSYACLEDTEPLLESRESKVLQHAVSFGQDYLSLGQTCRQIQNETACLPFKIYIWAFETAFTLDQWVSMKSNIPMQHKNAIRTVAVPTPGPYRSSERILLSLNEVLLIGNFSSTGESGPASVDTGRGIIKLTKDKASDTWLRSGERAQYAKDLFETA